MRVRQDHDTNLKVIANCKLSNNEQFNAAMQRCSDAAMQRCGDVAMVSGEGGNVDAAVCFNAYSTQCRRKSKRNGKLSSDVVALDMVLNAGIS